MIAALTLGDVTVATVFLAGALVGAVAMAFAVAWFARRTQR